MKPKEITSDTPTAEQLRKILKHLRKGKTINTAQAFRWWGITRLPARIYDLKQRGFLIEHDPNSKRPGPMKDYRLVEGGKR